MRRVWIEIKKFEEHKLDEPRVTLHAEGVD